MSILLRQEEEDDGVVQLGKAVCISSFYINYCYSKFLCLKSRKLFLCSMFRKVKHQGNYLGSR